MELASRAAEGAKELFAGELKVSVIIPSKDNPEVLEKCLHSLTRRSEGRIPVEILLVDNGSSAENKQSDGSGKAVSLSVIFMNRRNLIFQRCATGELNWRKESFCCF